jgi:hypothetical protein
MTLLGLLIFLVVVGVVLYLINSYIPMAPAIKNLINVVVVIIVILYVLQALGLLPFLDRPLPRVG